MYSASGSSIGEVKAEGAAAGGGGNVTNRHTDGADVTVTKETGSSNFCHQLLTCNNRIGQKSVVHLYIMGKGIEVPLRKAFGKAELKGHPTQGVCTERRHEKRGFIEVFAYGHLCRRATFDSLRHSDAFSLNHIHTISNAFRLHLHCCTELHAGSRHRHLAWHAFIQHMYTGKPPAVIAEHGRLPRREPQLRHLNRMAEIEIVCKIERLPDTTYRILQTREIQSETPVSPRKGIKRSIIQTRHHQSIGGCAVGTMHAERPAFLFAGLQPVPEAGPRQEQTLVGFRTFYSDRMSIKMPIMEPSHISSGSIAILGFPFQLKLYAVADLHNL